MSRYFLLFSPHLSLYFTSKYIHRPKSNYAKEVILAQKGIYILFLWKEMRFRNGVSCEKRIQNSVPSSRQIYMLHILI